MINLSCRFNGKDVAEYNKAIAGFITAMSDFTPLWQSLQPMVAGAILENFKNQRNYYEKWTSYKRGKGGTSKYGQWKINHGKSPYLLQYSGALLQSATRKGAADNICYMDNLKFVWGTALPYGYYHDSDAPRNKIPRREFMVLNPKTVRSFILRAIGDHVRESGLPTGVLKKNYFDKG